MPTATRPGVLGLGEDLGWGAYAGPGADFVTPYLTGGVFLAIASWAMVFVL